MSRARYFILPIAIFAWCFFLPSLAFAQATSSVRYIQPEGTPESAVQLPDKPIPEPPAAESPVLVADVNFHDVSTVVENGAWQVTFSVESSFGSQDDLSLGIIVRDLSGRLLDHVLVSQPLFLAEGVAISQTATYTPSAYLSADGVAYLTAYNARGLLLAIEKIGDVKRVGNPPVVCSRENTLVSCLTEIVAPLTVRIQQDGPFGKSVHEEVVSFSAGTEGEVDLSSITRDLPSGMYTTSFLLGGDDAQVVYATEYAKAGDAARIISVTPKFTETDQLEQLQTRVFAEAFSMSGAPHDLIVSTGTCEAQSRPFDGRPADFVFDTACVGGDLRVDFQVDGQIVDTLTATLAAQVSQIDASKRWRDRLLYGVFGLFVLSLTFIVGKRFLSRRRVMLSVLFGLTALGSVDVLPAHAATYVIGGTARYVGCLTGGWPGCAEPDPSDIGYRTTGTVTVPNSVGPSEAYTISITQSLTSSTLTQCKDIATAAWASCGPTQVSTEGFINLPAPGMATVYGQFLWDYNTLPGGYGNSLGGYIASHPATVSIGYLNAGNPTGVFSRTSPASGTADVLAFVQIVDAGFSVHCTDNCITYPYAYNSISVPMATTTCDRGCGGSVQWRANATNAIDDFTCPAGQKLITNRGSWTGPLACQGTFTLDPFGGTMSCVADAACVPPPPSCNWVGSGYIDGRQPPGANALHNSGRCSTPNPSDGSPLPSACNAGYDGGLTVCCDTGADCYRHTCNCSAPPACSISVTTGSFGTEEWPQGSNLYNCAYASGSAAAARSCAPSWGTGTVRFCQNGVCGSALIPACNPGVPCWKLSSTRTQSAASCTNPMSPPLGPAFPACTGTNQGALERRCDDDQPMLDLESTYTCDICVGSAPTLIMTGTRQVGYENQSLWSKVIAFFKERIARPVSASGPALNVSVGDTVVLNWTTTGAASCTLTVPGQLPQVVSPAQIATGTTVVSGLPAGSHTIRMTCANATGTQMVMDTVVVNVAPNELQICPPAITLTMGTVYQMRAFYLIGGVDCASLGPAIDVSNLVTWTSASPTVAAVGNNPTGGRINAGFIPGTADISISSYAGRTAPISRVTIVGGYAICPASVSTYVGDTIQLRAYFSALSPIDCSNPTGATDVTGSVTWFSSSPGVATVAAGLVTGVTGGSTSISLSPYNGATAVPVTINVSGGYSICPSSAIVSGAGFSFRSYYSPTGPVDCSNLAGTTDVTGSVTWTSSNPGVATVGNGGTAGLTAAIGIGSSSISTSPYSGIPSGNAVANVICIPSVTCASAGPAATAANTCPGETFTIGDGCGGIVTCPGTRICDFNWKEVGQ